MVGAALISVVVFIAPCLAFIAPIWLALAADSSFVLNSGKTLNRDLNSCFIKIKIQ